MGFECRVEADSVSPEGIRLTTFVVTFPRFILAEFNTHRALSRNAASSRAIPVSRRIAAVLEEPFVPEVFGANQKGMQAGTEIGDSYIARAKWSAACNNAIENASRLSDLGVHKSWANRLLEPFSWVTVISSATDWKNFFSLRCNANAQPEFRKIAEMMRDDMQNSVPILLEEGEWHLPLIREDDYGLGTEDLKMISTGRCARVSYLTHDGRRDISEDIRLAGDLVRDQHSSPLEHVATPRIGRCGNFRGWWQFRYDQPNHTVQG